MEEPVSFEKNIKRLAEVLPVIYKIRLLGGEPFLNRDLIRYCRIVRGAYPYTDIRVVTNGLTLDSVPEADLQALSELNIGADISVYPPTQKKLPSILALLQKYGVKAETTPLITEFRKRMDLSGTSDPAAAYAECGSRHCHFYNNGFLSACPAPYVIRYYCRRFGLDVETSEADRLSVWKKGLTAEEAAAFLERPMFMCRYCKTPELFSWRAGGTPKKEDWLAASE